MKEETPVEAMKDQEPENTPDESDAGADSVLDEEEGHKITRFAVARDDVGYGDRGAGA